MEEILNNYKKSAESVNHKYISSLKNFNVEIEKLQIQIEKLKKLKNEAENEFMLSSLELEIEYKKKIKTEVDKCKFITALIDNKILNHNNNNNNKITAEDMEEFKKNADILYLQNKKKYCKWCRSESVSSCDSGDDTDGKWRDYNPGYHTPKNCIFNINR